MKRKIIFAVVFFITCHSVFFCQTKPESKKKPTIEWRFKQINNESLTVPQVKWLKDNSLILFDYRKSEDTRFLEFFNVKSKQRRPAFDLGKVLSSLKKNLGKDVPQSLPWPDAIDDNGKAVLYILGGDLFLVELNKSIVRRLTHSSLQESSPAFSPDGKWVSFIRGNDIHAVEWEIGEEKILTTGATDSLLNGPLSWVYWEEIYNHTSVPYSWAPDSSALAYLQTDESEVSISTFVNFEPATQNIIRQRYPKAGQANPKVRLGIVELSSAKTTWIDCGQYEYIARFNWLRDSKRISVQTLNRKQSVLKLVFADRNSGKSNLILTERQSSWINLNDSLFFLKNGEEFIWMSERDGYQHLYLYKLDGQLIRQLTKGEFMVQSSTGRLVDLNSGLEGVDEEKKTVYFTSNKQSQRERHLYRIHLDGSGLEKLSQGIGIHASLFSPDMTCYLESYSNSKNPPSLTLRKVGGSIISTITPSAKPIIDQYNISFPEFHTFEADDGLELPAMLTKPAHFDPDKKYPVVIYIYGGPGSQQVLDSWPRFMAWYGTLAQEGFFEVVLEVRAGMGKNKALETSDYRHAYGMQNVKDILAGVQWLKSLPYIDSDNIGIWGWSGGGCTTLYTTTHTDVFKAAISIAPVSDWHFYDTIYTERYLSTPQDNPEGYRETSSVLAAKNLKTRLLIVHGTYDDNVHPQNTLAFMDQLIKHNIKFESMVYPWRKHGIRDDAARIHLYSMMLDFWKRNLKSE